MEMPFNFNYENSETMFSCSICSVAFDWKHLLDEHNLQKHSNGEKLYCGTFMDTDSLQCHSVNTHGGIVDCNRRSYMLPFVLFNSKTLTWDCPNCDKSFHLKSQFEDHVQSHIFNSGVLNTSEIPQLFHSPLTIETDVQHASPSKPVIIIFNSQSSTWDCSNCDKTFQLQSQLGEHLKSYNATETTSAPPFSSPPTASVYSIPTVETPYQPCSQSRSSNGNFSLETIQTVENPPKISYASGKSSSSNSSSVLKKTIKKPKNLVFAKESTHRISIMREGYQCKSCNVGFLKKQALLSHFYFDHENNEEEIQKRGAKNSRTNLKKKAKNNGHNQSIPSFTCKICRKKLSSEKYLLKHMVERHSRHFFVNGESYYCNKCQMRFSGLRGFHNHLKLQHISQTYSKAAGDDGSGVHKPSSNEANGKSNKDVAIVKVVQKDDSVIKSGSGFKIEVISSEEHETTGITSVAKRGAKQGKGGIVDYFRCKMCTKVFATVKSLRIHERMLHGDILVSKFNQFCRDNARRRKSSELEKQKRRRKENTKVKCHEKLINKVKKKLSTKCKHKRVNVGTSNALSSTMTACGVTQFCKEMTRRRGRPPKIGVKQPGNPASSSCSQKKHSVVGGVKKRSMTRKNVYQCIVCGLQLPGVATLKRHVLREHADRFDKRNENFEKVQVKSKKQRNELGGRNGCTLMSQGTDTNSSQESVPIPVLNVELNEEDEEMQERLLSEQIDEEVVVQHNPTEFQQTENVQGTGNVGQSTTTTFHESVPTKSALAAESNELMEPASHNKYCVESAIATEKVGDNIVTTSTSSKNNAQSTMNLEALVLNRSLIRPVNNSKGTTSQVSLNQLPDSVTVVTKSGNSEENHGFNSKNYLEHVESQPTLSLEKAGTSVPPKSQILKNLKRQELQIVLTRVDDANFDFNEFMFLNKLC